MNADSKDIKLPNHFNLADTFGEVFERLGGVEGLISHLECYPKEKTKFYELMFAYNASQTTHNADAAYRAVEIPVSPRDPIVNKTNVVKLPK